MSKRHPDQRKGWLWWLAIVIFLTGGIASYLLLHSVDPDMQQKGAISLGITLVLGGICVICATSEWWMRR